MEVRQPRRRARWTAIVSLFLALALAFTLAPEASAVIVYPNSIAGLGDSITRAFNTGWFPFTDAPSNSWTTGTTSSVNSHYRRILASNTLISGRYYNYARSGAKMADLNGQAGAVPTGIGYVTILMGANDVCTSSLGTMTAVSTFRSQFQSAMQTLTTRAPGARVYVVSIPDVYHLWELFRNNSTARSRWSAYQICQSLLANPTSTAQVDVDRRAAVRQRNIDLNAQLRDVCALYAQCRYDGDKSFSYKFAASDVSTRDYFHPSLSGQATVSRVTWDLMVFDR